MLPLSKMIYVNARRFALLNIMHENSKKMLLNQISIDDIQDIYHNRAHMPYFHMYTYKYFSKNPKQNDNRKSFSEYYKAVSSKSDLDVLTTSFNSIYQNYLLYITNENLHIWQLEKLEMLIAKFEISICKLLGVAKTSHCSECICTKDELITFMNSRDHMIDKVDLLKTLTVEYQQMTPALSPNKSLTEIN